MEEKDILEKLNNEQINVVKDFDYNNRIIAGPGTGKTTTIIAKILYLIFIKKVSPKKILVITFTNKAKNEIIERIKKSNPNEFNIPLIFTYHSFSAYFLRIELKDNEQDNFVIIDRTDQQRIIRKLKKQNPDFINLEENLFLSSLNRYKQIFEDDFLIPIEKKYFKLFKEYELEKKQNNLLDFDDLLYRAKTLLEDNTDIFQKWNQRFDYIFVDEFQDTNWVQFQLLKYLTGSNTKVNVVGDPDQNIYSWRGADIQLILDFESHFENTKTYFLSRNYRSTPEIVSIANKLISNNSRRLNNELYSIKNNSEKNIPKIYYFNSSEEEAQYVAKEIINLEKESNIKHDEIAIIYRNNSLSLDFEKSLTNNNISYKVIGGFKFYDRKEIKDTISLIGFLLVGSNYYFGEASQIPSKGIGPKTLEQIQQFSYNNDVPYYDALKLMINNKSIKKPKIIDFVNVIDRYRKILNESTDFDTYNFINNYLKDVGVFDLYSEEEGRIENILELLKELAKELDKNNFINSFIIFSQTITLQSTSDELTPSNYVTLITAHSSKGTEFKVVFVVGLSEGIFPSLMSIKNNDIEEERRSFYVSVTRAMERLYLTYSGGFLYNQKPKKPSSFLNGLNLEVVEQRNKRTFVDFSSSSYSNDRVEDFYKDNSDIKLGSNIEHPDYGVGVVIDDMDEYIRVAFDRKIGVKIIIKNNKIIKHLVN